MGSDWFESSRHGPSPYSCGADDMPMVASISSAIWGQRNDVDDASTRVRCSDGVGGFHKSAAAVHRAGAPLDPTCHIPIRKL